MADPDDHRLESTVSAHSSVFTASSAWHGEHTFRSETVPRDDYDELVRTAMQQAAEHPDSHRMAVFPTKTKSRINMLDVNKLTQSKKKLMVTRALESSGQDNEKLLRKIRARQDRVGVERSKVEVQFRDLFVQAEVLIGDSGLPTVSNSFKGLLERLGKLVGRSGAEKAKMTILKGVSGALKPGRMCLLLGPPGAGKSTLLKALAGKIQTSALLKINGEVTYNGKRFDEFVVERSAGYVEQTDQHYAPLTVRETFNFAASCQGSGYHADELHELLKKEKEQGVQPDNEHAVDAYLKANVADTPNRVITELALKLLGLEVCADTIVGDQLMRGISGGQKKRVTTGEVVVGGKKVMFMDEISTGLDSATTYLITKCLSNFCHLLDATLLVALLQPAPETYNLFDDVMLLSQGNIVFHGPREEVMPFFNKLGFECPSGKGDADFLQDVTIQKGQDQFRKDKQRKHAYMSVQEMTDAFYATQLGRSASEASRAPYKGSERQTRSLPTTRYGVSWKTAFKACMQRELKLTYRDRFNYYSRTFQIAYLAFLSATLFIKPGHDTVAEGQLFLLEIFFAALVSIFAGFGKIPETVSGLPVFYKQRENKFFPAWCFALPKTILDLPLSIWEALLWTAVPYFAVGFYKDAGRFWTYWLVLFLTNMASNALFRGCAAVGRDPIISSTVGVLAIFVLVFSGGIMLARQYIRGWWIWAYWISPVAFTVRSLALNEFTTAQWSAPYPYDPTISIADAVLAPFAIQTGYWWVWLGVGVLAGYAVTFNAIAALSYTFLSYPTKRPSMSEEAIASVEGESAALKSGKKQTRPEDSAQSQEQNGDAAVSNPGSAYGASALGPSASGASAATPANPVAQAGTQPEPKPIQPLQNGTLRNEEEEQGTLQNGQGKQETLEDGEEEAEVKKEQSGASQRALAGLGLPFDPVALTFKDIHYFVKNPNQRSQELELLKGITGSFRPGVLTALIGASGAGKTTLMDVLADRKTGGRTEGEQKLNGQPKGKATLARVMGYVEQDDIHTPALTVYESLRFSAHLRLNRDVNTRSEKAFVDDVLELVDMQGLRNALVGMPGISGLSVEQRKRLTIAVELVSNPSIVFMDEPTSGLDARAAAIVMRTVKNTVRTGRTVVCTIHQPSLEIFQAFDELLLLQRGGYTLYFGEMGKGSKSLIDYFQDLGADPIEEGYNPATWVLEQTTASKEEETGVNFAEAFQKSEIARKAEQTVEELSRENGPHKAVKFKEVYAKRFGTQYIALLKKFNTAYWRTPEYNYIRGLVTVILGFVLGTLYWKVGHKKSTAQDVTSAVGAVNAVTIFLGALYALNVLPVVSVERAVFYRERSSFFYSSWPFSLAQCTVEVPYLIVQAVVYSNIVYWCCGFAVDAGKFFWFLLFLLLTLDYFTHVGIMSVNISSNLQIATTVLTTLIPTWNVLSGFYIPKPDIRGWWIWAFYLNPMTWTTWGLVASQVGDEQNVISNPDGTTTTIADYVGTELGLPHYYIGWCVLITACWCLLFRVITALALRYLNFQTR